MTKTKVLYIVSEAVPFIKTGGLADVAGSLPKHFNKSKYDVRVMLPKYTCIPDSLRSLIRFKKKFYMGFRFQDQYVGIEELTLDGVHFYFLDSEYYFSGPKPYGDVYNDIEKFAFFARAVLSSLPLLNWKPDILHCHDWEAGLVPVYLNDYFQGDLFFHKMKTILTIHNLRFQGVYDVPTVRDKTGLSEYYFTNDKLESYGNGNILKGGLVYADRITTVSDTYAEEIQTDFYGEGLNGLLVSKREKLSGIVNGIDTDFYNPETDTALPNCFTWENVTDIRPKNKAVLQKEVGLPVNADAFLVGIVSRLTSQKGLDLVRAVFSDLLNDNIQFVILGVGEEEYESFFRDAAEKNPAKVSFQHCYSEDLAKRIYAGIDAFLMPSLFEPCGLSQLLALRYGAVPIVRETGGLRDTIEPYNEYKETGTGFSFRNYNAHEMLHIIRYAESIFNTHKDSFGKLMVRAMKADFSWTKSAKKYQALYDELMEEKREEECSM